MKTSDYVWVQTTNRKILGKIIRLNPHALDGSNVVVAVGLSELCRLPYELSLATDAEVVLWKLENA
jgi:hypothetical protein